MQGRRTNLFRFKRDNDFSIVPKQDGTIEISSFKLTEKDLIQLRNIGATVNGYLKVSVDKGVEVVKHNASSTQNFSASSAIMSGT